MKKESWVGLVCDIEGELDLCCFWNLNVEDMFVINNVLEIVNSIIIESRIVGFVL